MLDFPANPNKTQIRAGLETVPPFARRSPNGHVVTPNHDLVIRGLGLREMA